MTITTDETTGRTRITADEGKAVHRIGTPSPCSVIGVLLRSDDTPANWEDCELGEPDHPEYDATESDKDAALTALGVDMTEANQ